MKRLLIPLLMLAGQILSQAQGTAAAVRKGEDALAAGLWEIAELHFRQALADPSQPADIKANIAIELAESLVRSGNFTEALELLGRSTTGKNAVATFWKAQALAGTGRLAEASEIFASLTADPDFAHRMEAGFTRASLQLALGQVEGALDTLTSMRTTADAATDVKIRLYQIEILLDLGRPGDARQVLTAEPPLSISPSPHAEFLQARLLLDEDKPADAEARFQLLLNRPAGQTEARFHAAVVGLADAIFVQGRHTEALQGLLGFIQSHPDSPLLGAMFDRIWKWMPSRPTASDPMLDRISQWIVPTVAPSIRPVTNDGSAVSAWPVVEEPVVSESLQAYALFTRAMWLQRLGTKENEWEGRQLLDRLRWEFPRHPLAGRALFELGRRALDERDIPRAISILDVVRESSGSPLQGAAAFLEARAAAGNNDLKPAIDLFEDAARLLAEDEARVATLNAAILRLRADDNPGTTLIRQPGAPVEPKLEADIELERALSMPTSAEIRKAAEDFLTHFPDHPRTSEARLAAAEATLSGPAPDLSFAKAQLDTIDAAPVKSQDVPPARVALARLRITDLSRDPAATIAAAQVIMDSYPNSSEAAEAALALGRNYFQSGSYNPARLVLEKLAATDTDLLRAQAAWLLAARSAALGGTPRSKEEALILFDKALELKGPLASIAALEKSRHLIDMSHLPEASAFLRKWIAALPQADPLRLPAGLLLGEALLAQGSANPGSLVEALAVYDNLVSNPNAGPAIVNRLQYLRGNVLEKLPDEKDPSKKREKQAFQAYHSVLETTTPPAEWEYFELCGFHALALLEKAGRWSVAITEAKKIASFNGPRAAEAAARANELQLKHMVFED